MSGNRQNTAAHLSEHSYNRGPETSRTRVGRDNPTHAANFYLEQRAPTPAESQENDNHEAWLGYHSTSGSTSNSQARKRSRTASQARSASASKKSPSDSSAAESHRVSQRLQNRAIPLSSNACNLPSTSSATNPPTTKTRKSPGDKSSSGSKRSNFSPGQTAVLNGWLEANLEHPYPTESEKVVLARRARMSLNQLNMFYTNARRRAYLKMCEDKGIVPVLRKNKAKICPSEEGDKENQDPVPGTSDSGLASDGSRRTSDNSSPRMETSSPEIEASQEHVFVVDADTSDCGLASDSSRSASANSSNSPQTITSSPEIVEASPEQVFVVEAGITDPLPCEVPVFQQGSPSSSHVAEVSQEHVFVVDAGSTNPIPSEVPVFQQSLNFFPPTPLPDGENPEVLAVSRQVTDHPVYLEVHPQRGAFEVLLTVAEMFRDADFKAYERNMPLQHYIAERVLAETPGAFAYQQTGYIN